MGKTISANRGSFILSNVADNPLTILAGITVAGAGYGIYATDTQPWSITNLGTVTASAASGDGIELRNGGSVTNSGVNSHITGTNGGIYAGKGAAFITNQGTITGANDFGVLLTAGGTVTNSGTAATISGGQFGVHVTGTVSAAVINRGTISGTTAAVRFANVNNNAFVELPGAVVIGAVQAGSGTGNVLDLGSGATTGTISGIGSQYTGFQVLHEEAGATWEVTGANTLGAAATITLDGSAALEVGGTLIAPSNLTVTGTGTSRPTEAVSRSAP